MSGNRADETERLRQQWDRQAPHYDREMRLMERLLFGDGRAWVCAQAAGDVLEVAVGTGRNFPFYPGDVRLTGIDLSPVMLTIARRRAEDLGLDVNLREADAQALPFPDVSFDTVVCTLSLCTIPDDRRAVAEMWRVLRPGGRLLLLDHIRSSVGLVRGVQRGLEALTRGFDNLLRRPAEHVLARGFQVEQQERFKLGMVERLSARKPG